jgi:hypothetical protein
MDMAETLNLGCLCATLDADLLDQELTRQAGRPGMAQEMALQQPHLFSATPVFLSACDHAALQAGVAAIGRVVSLPAYQAQALERAPPIARHDFGPRGAFMGYDFHLAPQGPRLIEINSNAGAGLLNAVAARAHRLCCGQLDGRPGAPQAQDPLETAFVEMFRTEWRLQRGTAALRAVLIVDDAPAGQYLAPEFEIWRALWRRQGVAAAVADPTELQWRDGALWHPALAPGLPVDLVYNRLTDFYLSEPRHAALQQAYASGAVVLTPHPRAHALYADKRNLVTLSDAALLQSWGVAAQDRALLQALVPGTELVTPDNAPRLWTQRRQLFFKPACGYGGKAAYRGDKLTRRAWDDILQGTFIAQALVPPSERVVGLGEGQARLKLDLRAYVYDTCIQSLAARTYAGQTTNMRTPGGGFAPVVVLK